MKKIKVYFCEISDSNNKKHQIKTEKYDEILKFMVSLKYLIML